MDNHTSSEIAFEIPGSKSDIIKEGSNVLLRFLASENKIFNKYTYICALRPGSNEYTTGIPNLTKNILSV